jgi:hypothetical protein
MVSHAENYVNVYKRYNINVFHYFEVSTLATIN